jgi:hypothetical protein
MTDSLFEIEDAKRLAAVEKQYRWAVQIVYEHFAKGLEELCNERFLAERYKVFTYRRDPIYGVLLRGMHDEKLAKTFVSYWTIGQSLATRCRFWLQGAVAQLIARQVIEQRRERLELYTSDMLVDGLLKERRTVYELGEHVFEHMTPGARWEVMIKTSVLNAAALIVDEQERTRPPKRSTPGPDIHRMDTGFQAAASDRSMLQQIASQIELESETTETALGCNLLIVDPDKARGAGAICAIRFINPKTLSGHAPRRQERLNLLRLYGYLVQEKIFHDPKVIRVKVAELLPRYASFTELDHCPEYFTRQTYMTCDQLWRLIGVPFEVVTVAVGRVAKEFRQELIGGLRGLLPQA